MQGKTFTKLTSAYRSFLTLTALLLAGAAAKAQTVPAPYAITTFKSGLTADVNQMAIDQATGNIYYAGNSTAGSLYKITPAGVLSTLSTSWASSQSSWFPFGRTGIAFYSGKLYSFTPGDPTTTYIKLGILSIDATTGISSTVTTSAIPGGEDGNVIIGNTMYMTNGLGTPNMLYSYNFTTATFSTIGAVTSASTVPNFRQGLRYCAATGITYAMCTNGTTGTLYSVDLGTGAFTQLVSGLADAYSKFAVDPSGKYVYFFSGTGTTVSSIDLSTFVVTPFATGLSSSSIDDLAFGPSSSGGGISLYIGGTTRIYEVSYVPTFVNGSTQNYTICQNSGAGSINSLLTASGGTGYTFTWSVVSGPLHGTIGGLPATAASGIGSSPAGTTYTPNTGYSGNDTFTIQVSDGSKGPAFTKVYVTINPLPAPITGFTSLCVGSTTTLSDATLGGTWSSSNTSAATIGSSTGVVTGVGASISIISYTAPVTGCISSTIETVYATPAVISGPAVVCGGATIALTDATPSGVWNSGNTTVATVDPTGLVTGVSGGTATITYASPVTGCYAAKTITVNPMSAITGAAAVCLGGTTLLSDATTGGKWTSSNTAVATIGSSTGVVSAVALGTSTITYTILASGCQSTLLFTVSSAPATISGTRTICTGATTTLSSATAGGTWSSSNSSVASVAAPTSGSVSGVLSGTAVISYSLGAGCTTTAAVTVLPAPAAITGATTLCSGSATALTDATAGGTWSSSATGVATVTGTGSVSGIASGTATISYTAAGCSATSIVTVSSPAAAISGPSSVCAGTVTAYTDIITGGTWTNSGTAATITPAGVLTATAVGTTIVTYATSSACSVTLTVTVNAAPGPIAGVGSVCSGYLILLTDAGGGIWTSSNTAVATAGSSTGIINGITGGTATISYTLGSCFATTVVTVNPTPSAITGPSSVCVGSTIMLSDLTTGGTWSTASSAISVAANAVTGVSSGTAIVSYTLAGCSVTGTVNVIDVPATITGPAVVCQGGLIELTDATTGGVWTSSNTLVAPVGSISGNVFGAAAGTVTISYTVDGICTVTSVVSIDPPLPAITGAGKVCAGSVITMSNAVSGGNWTASNSNLTIDFFTGDVTGVTSGSSTVTYTVSSGCIAVKTISINPLPQPIGLTSSTLCYSDKGVIATDADAGGTWTSALVTVSATGALTAYASGTGMLTYTLPTGCATNTSITVNPLPGLISAPAQLCTGSLITLVDTTAGGTWASTDATVIIDMSTGGLYGASAGSAVITYILPTGCYVLDTIKVIATPSAITGSSDVCVAGSIALSDAVAGGIWSVAGLGVASVSSAGMVTGLAAGTATISYTTGSSCAATSVINVWALPTAYTISGSGSYCAGSAGTHVTLSGSATGVRYYLYNGGVLTDSLNGTGIPLDFGPRTLTGIYTITAVNTITGCNNRMTGSDTITVNPVVTPLVSIGIIPGDTVCAGTSVTFIAGSIYGGTAPVYNWKVNGVLSGSGSTYTYVPANADLVSLEMISNATCAVPATVTDFRTMYVVTPVTPAIVLTADPGVNIPDGTTVTFTATLTNSVLSPVYEWLRNNAVVPGETRATFTTNILDDKDTITCRVSSPALCVTASTAILYIHEYTTGGNNVSVHSVATGTGTATVLPNPNKGTFTVTGTTGSTADEQVTLELSNMLGQVIYKKITTAKDGKMNEQVQLSGNIANGTYLLNLRSASMSRVFHIIIEQ